MADAEKDALRPIFDAAKQSVEYHGEREDRDYPGYVWIEWDDLVRFVDAFGTGGSMSTDGEGRK